MNIPPDLAGRVATHLSTMYPDADVDQLATSCWDAIGGHAASVPVAVDLWDETDAVCITYGNTLRRPGSAPIATLAKFAATHLQESFSTIHVLPFFPSSSDFGFSVIDYERVAPELGTWDDIALLAETHDLMIDLVANHISAESAWFQQFLSNELPGRDYFVEADPAADFRSVVRPRKHPLLNAVETPTGTKHVWCTFSHDQVDVNFANPDVLLAFLRIVGHYLEANARFVRLDAIAYLWKELGTSCVHLPQTHAFVKLVHALLAGRSPQTALVTETNVPNQENLSYFGSGDEAHLIYNFSLPPLIVQALLKGSSTALRQWTMNMPPAPDGCAYLNFLSTHDGLGVRPVEQLLTDEEIGELVSAAHSRGGLHSEYDSPQGPRPYELNVSLFDLLGTDEDQPDQHVNRFVAAHTIMLGLEGIPAVYMHCLLATPNDTAAVDSTGIARTINRSELLVDDVEQALRTPASDTAQVFDAINHLLTIRRHQPAFHPNATQVTLNLNDGLFGFWRQSQDRSQTIFAIHNVTNHSVPLDLAPLNLIDTHEWTDLITQKSLTSMAKATESAQTILVAPYQSIWLTTR